MQRAARAVWAVVAAAVLTSCASASHAAPTSSDHSLTTVAVARTSTPSTAPRIPSTVTAATTATTARPCDPSAGQVGPSLSKQQVLRTADADLPLLVWQYAPAGDDSCRHEWNMFWVVELLNYEVGDGGFVQYFWNNKDSYLNDTITALTAMRATRHLALLRTAIARWRSERAAHPQLWDTPDGMTELYKISSLPALDDRWYQPTIEPFEAAYIRAHLDVFAPK